MSDAFQPSRYRLLGRVKRTEAGEVMICTDTHDSAGGKCTVLAVDDHRIMHSFIDIYDSREDIPKDVQPLIFSEDGRNFVVYPYVQERPISEFYMGGAMTLKECEEVCVNLIISCMTSNLPWPLLYLVLRQKEIQLAKDRNVYLSYKLDLTELDANIGESECAVECAKILLGLLEPKASSKAKSYLLLKKKTEKYSYGSFKELYKDVEIAAEPEKKHGIIASFKAWFNRNKGTFFRILLWISIILGVFVIVTFLTNLIFGDVPWLRLFIRSFEKIGLESLLQ
ncbi:MAG: hypothetical protein IKR23_08155 [Lachnospiraceae bacterium]|nr:hypothetical protein [Lachnospiraceae bacterium]